MFIIYIITILLVFKTNIILDKSSDDQPSVKDQGKNCIIPSLAGYCLEDMSCM